MDYTPSMLYSKNLDNIIQILVTVENVSIIIPHFFLEVIIFQKKIKKYMDENKIMVDRWEDLFNES